MRQKKEIDKIDEQNVWNKFYLNFLHYDEFHAIVLNKVVITEFNSWNTS